MELVALAGLGGGLVSVRSSGHGQDTPVSTIATSNCLCSVPGTAVLGLLASYSHKPVA